MTSSSSVGQKQTDQKCGESLSPKNKNPIFSFLSVPYWLTLSCQNSMQDNMKNINPKVKCAKG